MTSLRAMTRGMIFAGVMVGLAGPALAHPHVFIDTKVEVMLDAGNRATGLRISWTYDELYSLYVVGDMGLDPDWDGALTAEEEARLSGFDMNWDEGFAGDTYALMAERELALSGPQDWSASYAAGKITSVHVRMFDAPVEVGSEEPLVVQTYDPGYYTAYSIAFDPVLTGGVGCETDAYEPGLSAADAALKAALSEYTPDVDLEMEFPAVGKHFAEEVRVTCAAP